MELYPWSNDYDYCTYLYRFRRNGRCLDAMNSGEVDKNWAKEHHGLWAKEVEEESKSKPEPAE